MHMFAHFVQIWAFLQAILAAVNQISAQKRSKIRSKARQNLHTHTCKNPVYYSPISAYGPQDLTQKIGQTIRLESRDSGVMVRCHSASFAPLPSCQANFAWLLMSLGFCCFHPSLLLFSSPFILGDDCHCPMSSFLSLHLSFHDHHFS